MDITNLLDKVAKIQTRIETENSTTGELISTWNAGTDIEVAICSTAGNKAFQNGRNIYDKEFVIYCNFDANIKEGQRIQYNSKNYYIYRVFDPNELENHLELICDTKEQGI